MPELPSGTVTFLFTDIEGSTSLLEEHGERYAELLEEHRRVLREAFERHDGVEVDTQGDAFFVAFQRASDALAAAEEAQKALDIPVRMGVHTGEPTLTVGGYVGIDVHRAARICSAAHGRQVVVSESTQRLLEGQSLRDLGEHRLKDLGQPVHLYQLGERGFPPLRSLNATNLPVTASPLVGRGREVAELVGILGDSTRLVTLTGPGGTGKTRLGLQVAAELVERFPGGVFFVPLGGVRQPELVESTITSTVGLQELAELSDREALLFVDNFEHVLESAPVVGTILGETKAKVLVTSRAPLRVDGEQEYPVDPLPNDEAVDLLTQRARAVRPEFEPDEDAHEICRRLDGLPLALELAASRLRSLGSTALLERLDRRLPLLTGGRRDAPERQRTLRATIEWSYDLLDAELQQLFSRLSVFAGTFSLEAAERVTDATVDGIDALVEASLLKPIGSDRFLMLETIRELAAERFEESGDAEGVRLRHVEFFTELAKSANLNMEAEGPMRHDLVLPEHDNFRVALQWAIASGRIELALGLAVALENIWVTRDPSEGSRLFERLVPLAEDVDPRLHALALRCYGNCLAYVDNALAQRLYEQSLSEFRALGDDQSAAIVLLRVGMRVALQGDKQRARELVEQGLVAHRRAGFKKGEGQALSFLAGFERESGRIERSLELLEESVELSRETGFTWQEQNTLHSLAETLFLLGRPGDAGRRATEALEVAHRIGDRDVTLSALMLLARAEFEQGNAENAGRLWGAVEAEVERTPVRWFEDEREQFETPMLARAGPAFEPAREAGRRLPLEAAVEEALADA
jgi:predicted ATPase